MVHKKDRDKEEIKACAQELRRKWKHKQINRTKIMADLTTRERIDLLYERMFRQAKYNKIWYTMLTENDMAVSRQLIPDTSNAIRGILGEDLVEFVMAFGAILPRYEDPEHEDFVPIEARYPEYNSQAVRRLTDP